MNGFTDNTDIIEEVKEEVKEEIKEETGFWTDEMVNEIFVFQPSLSLRNSSKGKLIRTSQKILKK